MIKDIYAQLNFRAKVYLDFFHKEMENFIKTKCILAETDFDKNILQKYKYGDNVFAFYKKYIIELTRFIDFSNFGLQEMDDGRFHKINVYKNSYEDIMKEMDFLYPIVKDRAKKIKEFLSEKLKESGKNKILLCMPPLGPLVLYPTETIGLFVGKRKIYCRCVLGSNIFNNENFAMYDIAMVYDFIDKKYAGDE